MTLPVVVGVALEGHNDAAVRWAAAEARERGVDLRLVHGLLVPIGGHPGTSLAGLDPRSGLRGLAGRELADTAAVAREVAPGLSVDTVLVEGDPVEVLAAQARTASLVVVGSDGLGRFADLVLGGTVRGLCGHVPVLVVVPTVCDPAVRERADGRAPVVVGDDGTDGSASALRWAARRARQRGVGLVVVRAGDPRSLSTDLPDLGFDEPVPGPVPEVVVVEERADRALVEQGRDAELVVLGVGEDEGRRHRHRHHRTRPGLLLRATCPVAVVAPAPIPAEGSVSAAGHVTEEIG